MHVHLSEIDKTTEARATILCSLLAIEVEGMYDTRAEQDVVHPKSTLVGMENTARDSVDTNTYLRMAKRYEAVA